MYLSLSSVIEKIDFHYAIIKGDVLSLQAYGKLGERSYGDIDILIPRDKIKIFEKILEENGFYPFDKTRENRVMMLSCSHQVFPWYKKIGLLSNIIIDINFDLFWGEYNNKRICMDSFLSDTININVYGINFKTLPPMKALIQLILHHYKDMNSIFLLATRNSIKFEMFKDIFFLLKNNIESIPLDSFHSICINLKIDAYVFYVLYYTGKIFDDVVLKQYIETFRTSYGESLLDVYGLKDEEKKIWHCDFETRLNSNNIFELIKNDLNHNDMERIETNKKLFSRFKDEKNKQ